MRRTVVTVVALLLAGSTLANPANTAPGRCADITAPRLSALSAEQRMELLRDCDAEARVRLLLEQIHSQPTWYDAMYDDLTSSDVALGPALVATAERTAFDADGDFMLLMQMLLTLEDPGLPETRAGRKALLEVTRERAQAVRDPEARMRALSIIALLIGPLEQPVPGERARDTFVAQLVQSLIDDDSFHEAYIAPGDDLCLAVPACSRVTFSISRGGDDEEGDGTTHEYRVDFAIQSHRTFWVHQVGGRIIRAGARPHDCEPLAIP